MTTTHDSDRVPLDHLPATTASAVPPAGAVPSPSAVGSVPPCAPTAGGMNDVIVVAELRSSYDDRIARAEMLAEQMQARANAAARGYDRAVAERCAVDVLDDARALRLRTAIDAAVQQCAVDVLRDEAAATTGRPR